MTWCGLVGALSPVVRVRYRRDVLGWDYPSVSARDRRQHVPILDPVRIRVTPQEAYAALHLDELSAQGLCLARAAIAQMGRPALTPLETLDA